MTAALRERETEQNQSRGNPHPLTGTRCNKGREQTIGQLHGEKRPSDGFRRRETELHIGSGVES
jgi:hypothetical protein